MPVFGFGVRRSGCADFPVCRWIEDSRESFLFDNQEVRTSAKYTELAGSRMASTPGELGLSKPAIYVKRPCSSSHNQMRH